MTSTTTAPNQALVAAAPMLLAAIGQLKAFVSTTLTGDPLQIPARADAAADILLGNLKLQLPGLLVAEEGVVATDIISKFSGIETKLQALIPSSTPAAPSAAAETAAAA